MQCDPGLKVTDLGHILRLNSNIIKTFWYFVYVLYDD